MYSVHNEKKSVVAERFIRILMNKIYKCMTSTSKHVYIDKLDDIVNKYNSTYSTIKMKPGDVKSNTYIKEINDNSPKFMRISKSLNVFARSYVSNWSEEIFVIKKVKNTYHRHILSEILKYETFERFTKKNCKKQIKKSLELKK